MIHRLKCDAGPFQAVWERRKPFDVRRNDRGFQVGEGIVLTCNETGREIRGLVISYILDGGQYGVEEGHVVLGLNFGSASNYTPVDRSAREAYDSEKHEFTPEEIEAVRNAIRKAKEDAQEWARRTKVDWRTMNRPIGSEMPMPEPVDRSNQCTTSGESPEEVRKRQAEEGNKLHDSYIVLCDSERAKGFVRPYRDAYRHIECGKVTTMGRKIAETYARDPGFYGSTYCTHCGAHFPVGEEGEFVWHENDGSDGPKVGT